MEKETKLIPQKLSPKAEDDQKFLEEINQRIKQLPLKEKLKTIALSNLYQERQKLDEKLENKIRKLTLKYEKSSMRFFEQANDIIDGTRLPNEDELKGLDQFLSSQEKQEKNNALDASAIPNYWAKVFKNCDLLVHEIKEKDAPVFKHLMKLQYEKLQNNLDFVLKFFFDENNPYFKNSLLQKTFFMLDEDTPYKTVGTPIDWKDDEKNLTQKMVKRKQKNKKTGHTKWIEKKVDDDSFFLFFKSVEEEIDQERMNIDYDLARMLIEDVIPFSLEYFLGISVENEDNNEEESFEENYEDLDKKKELKKNSFRKKSNANIKIIINEDLNISEEKSSNKQTISPKNK